MAEGGRVIEKLLLLLLVVVEEEEGGEGGEEEGSSSKGRVALTSMGFFDFTRCSSKGGGPTRCGVS